MSASTLTAGDPAPDFSALAVGAGFGDGKAFRLSEYFNEQVVLYFYPQDQTPGCTAQACKLRDAWAEFGNRANLFGVSIDSPEAHREFVELNSLPFPLISDSDASEGGKGDHFRTERTTFIIAPGGRIKRILRKVDPYTHDRLLLEALYN